MATIETFPNGRVIAGWPNLLAFLYVLVLFVALRVLDDSARTVALAVAAAAYAGMIAGRLRGRFAADADGKKLATLVGGPADTLLLVGGALCTWSVLGKDVPAPALAGGILAIVLGAVMTLALELAVAPMRATGFVDNRRVQAAARTAATLVIAVAACAALTFGVEKLDIRRDFSFAAPTSPSAATLSMLEAGSCAPQASGKDQKVGTAPDAGKAPAGKPEVFLFFERGSTGLGEVRDYFDGLARAGATVTTLDSAVDPNLAKQLKVSKNGTVGFRCGARTDNYSVGDDREEAQKKVNKLDEEVRTRLAKLTKDAVDVYVTVGHGERSLDDAAKQGERQNAKGLKKLVDALNAKTKKLGLADGLSKEVPASAALVIIDGPTTAFLPDEATALASYVKNGGSVMLLLDPKLEEQADVTASLDPLLAALNLKVGSHEVLNDKSYVKSSNTDADHAFLFSTSFGNHKSVKTLSGARGKAALLFMSAADVAKRDAKLDEKTGPKVSMIARTPAASFIDVNDDRKADDKTEARAVLDLAAAVEMPKVGDGANAKDGRAIVVGDSDVLADMLIAQDANSVFAYETLLWLLRDDDKLSAGGIQSDEDVAIRHTRDEDTAWFYATVLVGPVFCLAGGLFFVRVKRRRRAPATTTNRTPAGGAQ